ncbi:MAG: hypothetical protein AB1505_12235 [Candidatus Latescibacterota bacterium]
MDRESWDVRLEVVQPGSLVRIQAHYVAEDLGEEVARTDSGVTVALSDSAGAEQTRIHARRLVLDHRADRLSLAGEVSVAAGDSLAATADSLVWDGAASQVLFPDWVLIEMPDGSERCRQLRAGLALGAWSAHDVDAVWAAGQGSEEVRVRALSEQARRGPHLWVEYIQPDVEYAGLRVTSAAAHYDEAGRRMEFEGQVSGVDSGLTLAAQRAAVDLDTRRVVAQGQARLQGEDFALQAQEVEQVLGDSLVEARGEPVVYSQGDRRIQAPRLVYDRRAEALRAGRGVELWDGERRLVCRDLVYERKAGRAWAEGGVALRAPEFTGSLTAGRLLFDLDRQRVELEEEPALRRAAAAGDSLRVYAGSMALDLAARTLTGADTFAVESARVSLRARRGRYRAEGEVLEAVEHAVLEHRQPEDDVHTRVGADSVVVYLEDGAVQRVVLPGHVEGWVQSGAGRTHWVEGQCGGVAFAGEVLQRFTLAEGADATHRDLERDEVSRFRGREMAMHFGGSGRIERVVVTGDARLTARLRQGQEEGGAALSEVSGQELEILFTEGRIAQVIVDQNIQGRYLPERKP